MKKKTFFLIIFSLVFSLWTKSIFIFLYLLFLFFYFLFFSLQNFKEQLVMVGLWLNQNWVFINENIESNQAYSKYVWYPKLENIYNLFNIWMIKKFKY